MALLEDRLADVLHALGTHKGQVDRVCSTPQGRGRAGVFLGVLTGCIREPFRPGEQSEAEAFTLLQIGDLSNNTELILTEPDVYSIRSPDGIGYAYLVLSERPILNIIYLNELYIYAEDAHSVDINVRQLFGLYPVFKLTNTDGGRIHVKLSIDVGEDGNKIPLEAGVLDVKYRTLPFLAPLFINDISTNLGTDHFIIPEPITTVLATLLAIIRGIGG